MLRASTAILAATSALMFGGQALAQSAGAQASAQGSGQITTPITTTTPVPPVSTIPPGTQLSVAPAAGAAAAAAGIPPKVQVVKPIAGVATPATPGALGADGLPSVETASIGNVAGLLSFCVHHRYTNGTTARVTGRTLAKRSDVQHDPGYSIGGQGLLQISANTPFDVTTLSTSKKTMLCSRLVSRGQVLAR